MGKLLLESLNFFLKLSHRLHEKFICVIENDEHLLISYLIQIATIIWVAKFGDFIKFVSKHVLIPNIVEIDKEVDLVYSSLNEVGCCLNGKGCFADSRVAIQKE